MAVKFSLSVRKKFRNFGIGHVRRAVVVTVIDGAQNQASCSVRPFLVCRLCAEQRIKNFWNLLVGNNIDHTLVLKLTAPPPDTHGHTPRSSTEPQPPRVSSENLSRLPSPLAPRQTLRL